MNRFKGLDLVNRVPEEQETEVHNIVQEARNKKRKRNFLPCVEKKSSSNCNDQSQYLD